MQDRRIAVLWRLYHSRDRANSGHFAENRGTGMGHGTSLAACGNQQMSSFSPEQWARIKELFEAARELPDADQTKFLNEKCPDDSVTRSEVERLIASAQKSEGLLDSPSPFQIPARPAHERAIPERISRYRIIEKLGEGGMGVVY